MLLIGGPIELDSLGGILLHAIAILKALPHQHLGPGVALLGRLGKQLRRHLVVLLKMDALVVKVPQVALGGGIVLVGGLLVQLGGVGLVHYHPVAQLIAQPQLGHGGQVVLVRPLGKQLHRTGLVFLHADAPDIAQPQVILRGDVIPFRGLVEPVESLLSVLGGAVLPVVIAASQAVHRLQVAVLGGLLEGLQVLLFLLRQVVETAHQLGVDIDHHGIFVKRLGISVQLFCHKNRFLSLFLKAPT